MGGQLGRNGGGVLLDGLIRVLGLRGHFGGYGRGGAVGGYGDGVGRLRGRSGVLDVHELGGLRGVREGLGGLGVLSRFGSLRGFGELRGFRELGGLGRQGSLGRQNGLGSGDGLRGVGLDDLCGGLGGGGDYGVGGLGGLGGAGNLCGAGSGSTRDLCGVGGRGLGKRLALRGGDVGHVTGLSGFGLGNLGGVSGFGNRSDIPGVGLGYLACIGDHIAGLGRGCLGRLGSLRDRALSSLRDLGGRNGLTGGRFSGHERLGNRRSLDGSSDLGALSTDRTLSDPGLALRRRTDARNLLATVPAGHGPSSRHGVSGLAPTSDRVTGAGGHDSRALLGTGNSPVALPCARGHRPLRNVMTGHRLGNRRDTGSSNSNRLLPRVHTLLGSGPGDPSHRRLCHTDRLLRGNNRFGSQRLRTRRPGGRSLGGGAPGCRRLRDRGVRVLGAHRDRAGLADRCADGASVGEGADRARGGVRDGRAEVQGRRGVIGGIGDVGAVGPGRRTALRSTEPLSRPDISCAPGSCSASTTGSGMGGATSLPQAPWVPGIRRSSSSAVVSER
nr:hypothetical protein [Streptomyces chartreusis]